MDNENVICRTVGDLIAELGKLPPETVPISHEPPFTGVMVVPNDGAMVLLASLWNTDEGRAERAARKVQRAA